MLVIDERVNVNDTGTRMVIEMVSDRRAEVAALCERYGVVRLDLFGSATTGAFDPATSDLDFVVDLGDYEPGIATRYIELAFALEALFGRPVDLLTVRSLHSPSIVAEVAATRKPIYAR